MKRRFNDMPAAIIMALLAFGLVLSSCKKDSSSLNPVSGSDVEGKSNHQSAPLTFTVGTVPLFVEDVNRQPASSDETLLYEVFTHQPVLAPDGHHVTWGEFSKAGGSASVKCVNKGTHVTLHFTGLIPNGVYTVWVVTFKAPGFEPTFANQIGEGSLGAPDGSENQFNVSASGTGSISIIMPAQQMSEFGTIDNCMSSEYEVQIVTAYHMDGRTHGQTPGPEGTWTVHSGFGFMGSQLQ